MIARSFTTGGHFEERTMTVSKNVLMALLILSYATWGGGMIAMKYAFESFTAMQVVFARVAFAGVIYLALYRLWSHIPYQRATGNTCWRWSCSSPACSSSAKPSP